MRIRTLVIGLVAVAVVGTAIAATKAPRAEKAGEAKAGMKGSIAVAKEADTKLVDMAKISLADAVAAALTKVPGKCWKAELEPEDGVLIFTIQVVTKEGAWKEIAVDAGNAAVLKVENGDREEFGSAGEMKEGKEDPKDNEKDGDED